jgi:hypothetical protein
MDATNTPNPSITYSESRRGIAIHAVLLPHNGHTAIIRPAPGAMALYCKDCDRIVLEAWQ